MFGESREDAVERFAHSLLIHGKGMPEDKLRRCIAGAPVSVFCCNIPGIGILHVSIVLIECRCPSQSTQERLLIGLSQEGRRLFVDGQWRPVLDFYEGLVLASLDSRLTEEEAESHRLYAFTARNLLDQLHILGEDAVAWMPAREALLKPVGETLRPSKRRKHSGESRPPNAAAPSTHFELEVEEGDQSEHWAEGLVGQYELAKGDWNGRPFFRCVKELKKTPYRLEVTIFFAAEPGQRAQWWISHGTEGESQMLRSAADNTNLPPERGWADLAGDPAPAGFKVSAGEDGRSVNVLIERSRAVKPQGTPGAGQTELPQKGGEAVKQSSDGSATEQPPSAGAARSDSQVVQGEAQGARKEEEDVTAGKEKADGAQSASNLSSAAPRGGDSEEDSKLGTAELDKLIICEAFTEYWRTLSRAKQDELFKEWNLKYPEGGCPYNQYILAWFARQDLRKKERTQESDAGCRVAQEREDEAAARVAPHRR